MPRKEAADPTASALAQKRWDKTPPEERSEIASKLAAKRWEGHIAKRPASGRKKAAAGKKKPAAKEEGGREGRDKKG
jgi:hypothetical protein